MKQYVCGTETRPLCVALFGPPGSGKSFTVDQLIKELDSPKLNKVQINMAQINSVDRLNNFLVSNLHTRAGSTADLASSSKGIDDVLLIFFDEFDCEFNGQLGWLKYFLAPMEDALLGPASSPGMPETFVALKRSILFFAGGTKKSYGEFSCKTQLSLMNKSCDLNWQRDQIS